MEEDGEFSELSRIRIAPPPTEANRAIGPNEWDAIGPKFSIAWTGSGSRLVAASDSGTAEFVVIRVTEDGTHLVVERDLTACRAPQNLPLGIVTLNGVLTPPPTPSPGASALPSPSPSPTMTPSRTPTLSATPSPSATSTSFTPTETLEATAPTRVLFLPLLIGEVCSKVIRRVDAILVIDASESMLELTSSRRSRIDAAREAAAALLGELDFAAGDEAGIVIFNSGVTSVTKLTSNTSELEHALSTFAVGPGTCLACGLEEATDELQVHSRESSNVPVLILLTDGQSNVRPISEAIEIAHRAKARGVVIFVVGVGGDLEVEALRMIASGSERYHEVSDAEALRTIFLGLVTEIPCPSSLFWPNEVR